jgi:vacuolar iron transporter family protein
MNIKDLIKKEQKFARYEYQIKVKADVSEEDVRKLGARELGSVLHEDTYFLPKGIPLDKVGELIRIRKECGENHLSVFRGMVANEHMRTRLVLTKHVSEKDVVTLTKTHTESISINKRRIIYILDHIVINLDRVENLGSFIEFDVGTRQEYSLIESLMRQLGLSPQEITNKSYFELGLAKFNSQVRLLGNLHARFGKFAFGIASAVLTTLGIIVGINSATASRLAIIGGIVAVAVADSLSDAVGMYSQKVSERGTTPPLAFRCALNTFLGKIIFTLTFIIPFLLLPPQPAILTSILWGMLLMVFVSVQIAFVQEQKIGKIVTQNISIALLVIIVSYLAGYLVATVIA